MRGLIGSYPWPVDYGAPMAYGAGAGPSSPTAGLGPPQRRYREPRAPGAATPGRPGGYAWTVRRDGAFFTRVEHR
eukprot:2225831-Prymnesium_polylepis.1